jgi:uncharacterized integral membrane protein (TIGR00698 family)
MTDIQAKAGDHQSSTHPKRWMDHPDSIRRWAQGVGFTFLIALAGLLLSRIPGLSMIGPMAIALIIAVIYRQVRPYPEHLAAGIRFSSKRLLRLAIILYGLKLNLTVLLQQGTGLLLRDILTVLFAIGATVLLARWLKADLKLSLLLGIGTGVCGAAAIAAASPLLKAREEDTAISVGMIALVGTVFALTYTALRPLLPLTDNAYGIWTGISLHEIAHVVLAAAPAGEDALTVALLAKLGRVALLIPLCFIIMLVMKKRGAPATRSAIEIPWFLLGFILMSIVGSLLPSLDTPLMASITSFLLTMAMVGLGLNVRLADLRTKARRPLIVLLIVSVMLSLLTYIEV